MKILKSGQKVKSIWKKYWFSQTLPKVYGLYTGENVNIYGRPLSILVYTFKIDQTWLFLTIYYQWNGQCSTNGTPFH